MTCYSPSVFAIDNEDTHTQDEGLAITYLIGTVLSSVFDDGIVEIETNGNVRGDGTVYPMFGFGIIATNPRWRFGMRAAINDGIEDSRAGTNSFGGLLIGYKGRSTYLGNFNLDMLIGVEDVPPVGDNQFMISPRLGGQLYKLGKAKMPFNKFIDFSLNWGASYRIRLDRNLSPKSPKNNSAMVHFMLSAS